MSIVNDIPGVGCYPSTVNDQKLQDIVRGSNGTVAVRKLIVGIIPLALMLLSCRAPNLGLPNNWSTYQNPRYNFEFPYPSNWEPFPIPDNLDGQAFRDPQNPSAEVRGWAGHTLSEIEPPRDSKSIVKSERQNFTTQQGLTGKLQVEIGSETSLMTLTLSQGNVRYTWQGRSDSEEFANYYRFFSYVANQYRLPPSEEN